MLAHVFESHESKLQFPVLVQPKLDGIRMLAARSENDISLTTRTGKPVPHKHDGSIGRILDALRGCPAFRPGMVLDGEMYAHGQRFQDLASAFKTDSGELAFHVFDVYDSRNPGAGTQERLAFLENRLFDAYEPHVVIVPYMKASSRVQVFNAHDAYVKEGYEGCMVRAWEAPYEPGKRSSSLLKLKRMRTDEFVVVDLVEATGADRGTAIFVCRIEGSDQQNPAPTFKVRMKATRAERASMWQQHTRGPSTFVGKRLTVQFQELTAAGIPRFPIGLAIRDYE